MGIFSTIAAGVGKIVSVAKTAIHAVKERIVPVIQKCIPKVAETVKRFSQKVTDFIEERKPAIEEKKVKIENIVKKISNVVSTVAEAIGLKKPDVDQPEELAMKAEKEEENGVSRQTFDSAKTYIEHLQNDVQLTDAQKIELRDMEPEQKIGYVVTGTAIYVSGVAEVIQVRETIITPKLLDDFDSLKFNAQKVIQVIKALDAHRITDGDLFSDLLHGKAIAAEERQQLRGALEELSDGNPNELLQDMRDQL